MKITYPTVTINITRAVAERHGHTITGRWKKVGLSFAASCQTCGYPVVVTPSWYPWEQEKVWGYPLTVQCGDVA